MIIIAVVGLGYVGLGLATAFAGVYPTWGYDIDSARIAGLKRHEDRNQLIESCVLAASTLRYTDALEDIRAANFFVVSVATPAYFYELPNLEPLIAASIAVAQVLKIGDVVVFESTVYPGTTDETCIPLLEKHSGLKHGQDFYVGYSPERINPVDTCHTLSNIPKIIAAADAQTLERIRQVYQTICDEVYPVSSIATAEAVKILENTQRDVNIALMNEFSMVMHALHLNVHEIIAAASTKWSFVPFKPGLVGGHCISIDPLYLSFQAKRHGVQTDLILAARKINDGMTGFILQAMVKLLILKQVDTHDITVGLLGGAYKENTVDTRNSLSLKLAKELRDYGFKVQQHDPSMSWNTLDEMQHLSVLILLVGHDSYRALGLDALLAHCKQPRLFMDIPNLFIDDHAAIKDMHYWSL